MSQPASLPVRNVALPEHVRPARTCSGKATLDARSSAWQPVMRQCCKGELLDYSFAISKEVGAGDCYVGQIGCMEHCSASPPSGIRLVRVSEGGSFALREAVARERITAPSRERTRRDWRRKCENSGIRRVRICTQSWTQKIKKSPPSGHTQFWVCPEGGLPVYTVCQRDSMQVMRVLCGASCCSADHVTLAAALMGMDVGLGLRKRGRK